MAVLMALNYQIKTSRMDDDCIYCGAVTWLDGHPRLHSPDDDADDEWATRREYPVNRVHRIHEPVIRISAEGDGTCCHCRRLPGRRARGDNQVDTQSEQQ